MKATPHLRVNADSSGIELAVTEAAGVARVPRLIVFEELDEESSTPAATFGNAHALSDQPRRFMTRTARVYKIEMLIRSRGHLSFQALLDELEASPATLKRDLGYLKDQLGAPIEYDRLLNGYRFGGEFRGQKHKLPGLWSDARELCWPLMAHQLPNDLESDGVIMVEDMNMSRADTPPRRRFVKAHHGSCAWR